MNENTKNQAPNTKEAPTLKLQLGGIAAPFGIWSLVFGIWCLVLSPTACASDFDVDADRYLNGLVQSNLFSGAVLVAQNGKPLLSKGYSFANREHDILNTPQTAFRLGSITKQFTSMCILILQKEGKLGVQDPVSKFVEESPEAWKPITLHHLLTHTSGIPGFTEFEDNLRFERLPTTVEATVRRFKDKPLKFSPGEKFNYSNSGYVLLGYVIEKVTGKKYEEVVRGADPNPEFKYEASYMDHSSGNPRSFQLPTSGGERRRRVVAPV